MSALAGQVAVQRVQGGPQLPRRRDGPLPVRLALELGHGRVDAIDADLRVLGLAVPDAPAQALDLRDDHRLRRPSRWVLVRQHAGDLLQMLQPHGEVNQSSIGGAVTPASARMRRSPGQPSVKAVSAVSPVLPMVSRARRISAPMSVLTFATAPKNCRPPDSVSTLPIRTSRCRWPSSQLRMKVESKVTMIASASTLTGSAAADVIDRVLAIWKV